MSEIIKIEIQADQSGANETLQQVNDSLKEGKEAAEALNHVLDGDLADAFKSLGELSKTLGVELGLAFSPAEINAFVQVIADVTDKLSKLIADTFIYTDEQKALDAQIKSSNQVIAGYATDIKKLDDEFEKMGKTASQKTAIDIGKLKSELNAANEAVLTLTGDLKEAKENAADPNLINALGNAKAIPALNDALGVAQQHQKLLFDEMRNLTAAFHAQQDAELEAIAEAEISGRLRVQEASVNAERAKWDRIRELTHTGADQNVAVETGFENRLYQVKREALRERLELMKLEHNAVAITALSREIEALAKEHEAALTRIQIEGDRERQKADDDQKAALAKQTSDTLAQAKAENDAVIKAADQQFQVWDEGYKGQIAQAKTASETQIQLIEQRFAKGKISQQEEIKLIAQAKETELATERNFQQQRFALWDGDKKKQQEIQNAIDLSYRQGSLIATKAVTDGLKAQEAQYKQIFSQIGSAITSNVMDVLKGTETITQGFQKMYQGLVTSLLDYFAKKAEKMAEDWLLEQIFGKQKGAANVGQATSNVAVAGTEALASVPWPFNIAAAAETEGVGTGLIAEAGVAFYALGGIVPQDGLAYLHKNEKVIPASMSGKGDGLGGSGVTVVVNHSVSAVDAASFQGHIRRHSNMIANEVTRALKRKGYGKQG